MGGRSVTVGYVNGDKVSNELVQQYSQEYQGNQLLQEEIHKYVWERIVSEKLLTQKTTEAGIVVTADEMGDMFLSSDPSLLSPTVVRRLGDPKTRQVNTEQVKQAIDMFHNPGKLRTQAGDDQRRLEELMEQQANWISLEKSVKIERLQNKYFTAVEKGMYTPTWMVEMEQKTQETSYNFDYVRIPYLNVEDKIEVSDQEMTDYIAAHPRQYKREASANIEYIVFDVNPTPEDSAAYLKEMTEIATEFKQKTSMKEDSSFIAHQYGEFPINYYTKDEMAGNHRQCYFQRGRS